MWAKKERLLKYNLIKYRVRYVLLPNYDCDSNNGADSYWCIAGKKAQEKK